MQNIIWSIFGTLRKPINRNTTIILILFLTAIVTPDSMAQSSTGVIRVATPGSDTSICGPVAAPGGSLQFAVDLIPEGGSVTILVAEGTYV